MGLLALVSGGTLNAVAGPRGAYVVAGSAGLLFAAAALLRMRGKLPARSAGADRQAPITPADAP